jgi:hypothetical protein
MFSGNRARTPSASSSAATWSVPKVRARLLCPLGEGRHRRGDPRRVAWQGPPGGRPFGRTHRGDPGRADGKDVGQRARTFTGNRRRQEDQGAETARRHGRAGPAAGRVGHRAGAMGGVRRHPSHAVAVAPQPGHAATDLRDAGAGPVTGHGRGAGTGATTGPGQPGLGAADASRASWPGWATGSRRARSGPS